MHDQPARGPSVPPVYVLVALLVMGAFHLGFPMARMFPPPYHYAGLVLMGLAIALILWAALHFRRLRTAIIPFQPSTALVTSGPYELTRNPMYLGMAGLLLGAGVFLGTVTPFIVIPAFMGLIRERFILAEEALMEETFGQAYLDYKAKVRRWL
ncbi:MAG: methyltransferase family protein [Betaproteobacteria bacterium]